MSATRVLQGDQPVPRLRLCGDLTLITADGVSLHAKDLALLAYLRLEQGPHSRETLTALLWGESPDEKARASLRQALTRLRNALGAAILVDRANLELVPEAIECDVAEFIEFAERLASNGGGTTTEADLAAALAIEVPRFHSGVAIRNSPAFEDWASALRTRLTRRYLQLLALAVRDALAKRAWRDAGRFAERWVTLAPFDDEPVAALMEARFLSGDAADALAAYTDHATRIAAELRKAPSHALIELAARIRRESRSAHHARSPRAATGWHDGLSFSGSLIGRAAEWEALKSSWEEVCEGTTRVVLIEGEPGSGKTRLADDFLRWVATQGGTVLRGACDANAGAPFGAVIETLRSGLDAPGLAGADPDSLAQVGRLLPEVRRRFSGLPNAMIYGQATESWRLFEAVAQVVLAIADESPMTILIDDLQWCDADSCSLIQFLIRRTSNAPVLWCITFTSGESSRDAPPARLHRALRPADGTVTVPLRSLTEQDILRLIRELGRIESPMAGRRFASRLHAVTAGNPFFVIELLKTLFARRLLGIDAATGAWVVGSAHEGGASAPLITQTVQDAIAERVEGLPEELHVVLATIAVAGRGCSPSALSHMHGISRLRAAALSDALVDRRLVVEENGQYRCAHPMLADVIQSRLSTSWRRETHRALALSLEFLLSSSSFKESEMGEIARHAEQGGDRAMAYRYALLAADACSRRSGYEEARSWLELATLCAETVEESEIASRHVAALVRQAGWREAPPLRAPRGSTAAGLELADLDLPPTA